MAGIQKTKITKITDIIDGGFVWLRKGTSKGKIEVWYMDYFGTCCVVDTCELFNCNCLVGDMTLNPEYGQQNIYCYGRNGEDTKRTCRVKRKKSEDSNPGKHHHRMERGGGV